jgi:MoaA/NifB/PqqE/SkfB family radical SAM enzyme
MPLESLDIHLTNKCNLQCRHCLYSSRPSNDDSSNEIKLKDYSKLFNDLISISGKKSYVNFLGGEPILKLDFWKIVNIAKKLRIKTNLISNFHFNKATIDKIFAFEFDRLSFGLHGREKNHDWLRNCNGDHAHIIKIIKKISSQNNHPLINITSVLHNNNLMDIEYLLNVAKNLKIDSITFLFFTPIGRGVNYKNLMINSYDWNSLKNRIKKWKINNNPSFSILFEAPYKSCLNIKNVNNGFCSCLNNHSLEIRNDGRVYFCGLMSAVDGPCLGNIKKESLSKIYKSLKPQCSKNFTGCIALALFYQRQGNELIDPRQKNSEWIPACPYKIEFLN